MQKIRLRQGQVSTSTALNLFILKILKNEMCLMQADLIQFMNMPMIESYTLAVMLINYIKFQFIERLGYSCKILRQPAYLYFSLPSL